jgi:hypothetical protein
MQKMLAAIGPQNVDAVRIGGLHEYGEVLYPQEPGYRYLAYSPSAMRGTSLIPANPVPNWRPGQASPNGEARTFWNWYSDSLAAFCNFQVRAVRNAGFGGDVQWELPGNGARPPWVSDLIASNLDLSSTYPNDYHISGGGADWVRIIDAIQTKDSRTVITQTGINDSTAYNASEQGTNVYDWSAAHWVASLADKYGLRKSAENDSGHVDLAGMQMAFKKMNEYGYEKLMWAFDNWLHDGGHATISQYGQLISQNP